MYKQILPHIIHKNLVKELQWKGKNDGICMSGFEKI